MSSEEITSLTQHINTSTTKGGGKMPANKNHVDDADLFGVLPGHDWRTQKEMDQDEKREQAQFTRELMDDARRGAQRAEDDERRNQE